jgi:hypothetical protein
MVERLVRVVFGIIARSVDIEKGLGAVGKIKLKANVGAVFCT